MKRGQQRRLAKLLGISPPMLCRMLSRKRRPSPDLAERLEKLTGIDARAWLWPDKFVNPYIKAKIDETLPWADQK